MASTRKIFVSRLRWTDCAGTLKKYFSKFGKVSFANVIYDRETGWSKNYGFVTMDSEDSVKNVMSHQPHMLTDDQEIQVAPHTVTAERSTTRIVSTPKSFNSARTRSSNYAAE